MDDLRILIARLGWPSTSTRWWTMQELAARLGEPATKDKTEYALLDLLRSRKLEAEVVEVLCIFWMAVQKYGYPPPAELADSVPKPSLLSDLLLESCGQSIQSDYSELKVAPQDFVIPDDFGGVQGVDLPRIFQTQIKNLETHTKFPLLRQMAYEWAQNQTSYPDAQYQGDLWHFLRPLGEGFVGQFSARAALRSISAYLRTLAVAKMIWKMPRQMANKFALLALPTHPTLAFLRPRRPDWLQTPIGLTGDRQKIEEELQALLARINLARPGDELIAFHSPISISLEHCVEISLLRWTQTTGGDIPDADLAAHLEGFWNHSRALPSSAPEVLSTTTLVAPPTLKELVDNDCMAWPLAGTLDLYRMGYLQHDLYPSRLFLPTMSGTHNLEVTPRDHQLDIKVNGQTFADLSYWNAGWGPARPRQFLGNCGTALVSRGTAYRAGVDSEDGPLRGFYLWQVRTLSRDGRYGKLGETLATGVFFV